MAAAEVSEAVEDLAEVVDLEAEADLAAVVEVDLEAAEAVVSAEDSAVVPPCKNTSTSMCHHQSPKSSDHSDRFR